MTFPFRSVRAGRVSRPHSRQTEGDTLKQLKGPVINSRPYCKALSSQFVSQFQAIKFQIITHKKIYNNFDPTFCFGINLLTWQNVDTKYHYCGNNCNNHTCFNQWIFCAFRNSVSLQQKVEIGATKKGWTTGFQNCFTTS